MASINGVTRSGNEPVEHLTAAVQAGGAERWAAMAALAESSDSRAYGALEAFAASADWTLRAAAVTALSQRSDGARATDLLRARLSDTSSYVVRAACDAVVTLRLSALRAPVVALVNAPEAATRSAALRALEAIWVREDTPIILQAYRVDRAASVRRDAAWVLRNRAEREMWPTLVSLWRSDSLARHRTWACELAGASGAPPLREMVRSLVADPDGHVRAAARRAVGEAEPSAT